MSVSAKYVHESLRIGNGTVSVTSSRFLTINKAKLGAFSMARYVMVLLGGAKVSSLSLSHLLVVSIEALVRILYQECVLHGNRSWG